jgi:Uma2 family endonuclease
MTTAVYRTMREAVFELAEAAPDYAVELDDTGVHLLMPPVNRHELAVLLTQRRLTPQLGEDEAAHAGGEIDAPELGRVRRPDLVVIPIEALTRQGYLSPSDVELVMEVVSKPNPENDWVNKTADYPAMGIPVYVIVDPRTSSVTVFEDPGPTGEGTRYRSRRDYTFGETVTAGPYTLDTKGFMPYDDDGDV